MSKKTGQHIWDGGPKCSCGVEIHTVFNILSINWIVMHGHPRDGGVALYVERQDLPERARDPNHYRIDSVLELDLSKATHETCSECGALKFG